MKKIYADNSSTSFPKAPGVGAAMQNHIENSAFNISRGGYEQAYEVMDTVLETRALLRKLFNFGAGGAADDHNVVFVPSVTYGLNFIINGLVRPGDHMVISAMEHNAVARPAEALKNKGAEVTVCPCDTDGTLDPEAFEKAIRPDTRLVVMSLCSNVSGTLQDGALLGRICRDKNVPLVLDAAQAAGAVDIDFDGWGLAGLCVPGHKGLLGPQGIGAMLLTDQLAREMKPTIFGGTGSVSDSLNMPDFLPDKFEAGTLNIPGIIGLNVALKYVMEVGPANILEHERRLSDLFIEKVQPLDLRIIAPADRNRRTGVVSLAFRKTDNAEAAFLLDDRFGIMTRCGLHCAPLAHRTLGTFPEGTVRFSFGHFNTEEDVEYIAECVGKIG